MCIRDSRKGAEEDSYIIELALAGFSEEDVTVSVKESNLTVSGELSDKDNGFVHQGISQRKFSRNFVLADDVVVGAGAQVLGPITVGEGARVGANAVVLKDVPRGATMVGIAARPAARSEQATSEQRGFAAYGTPSPNVADPMSRSIEGLLEELTRLRTRIEQLENVRSEESVQHVTGKEAEDVKGEGSPPNC